MENDKDKKTNFISRLKNLSVNEMILIGFLIIAIILVISSWDRIEKKASKSFEKTFKTM